MKYRWRDRLFPNRGLTVSLAILLVATLGTAGYLMYTLTSQRTFLKQGSEGVRAAYLIEDVSLQLRTAESATRGYVLTGDESYLDGYESATRKLQRNFEYLENSSALQFQRDKLKRLHKDSDNRMDILQRAIELRREVELSEFVAQADFAVGKRSMDGTLKVLNELSEATLASVWPAQMRAATALQRALVMAPVMAVVVIALCAVIVRYFTRGIERERAIEGSKNEFLSLASHQLRTPATNVKQYIHLVLDGYFGTITTDQRRALETATRNNDIEISIINDLLDIAKVDLNQILVRPEPHDAAKLVRQVMKEFKAPTKKRHQTLSYREPQRLPLVRLDPTYFKSVVENLLDNASKYSPQHSAITVSATVANDRYQLTVADKGVGIPRKERHRLFKKFSRISNDLSSAVEGSGLGLYWVKRVVELHHGNIRVESKPGDGSRFIVSLPLAHHERV